MQIVSFFNGSAAAAFGWLWGNDCTMILAQVLMAICKGQKQARVMPEVEASYIFLVIFFLAGIWALWVYVSIRQRAYTRIDTNTESNVLKIMLLFFSMKLHRD